MNKVKAKLQVGRAKFNCTVDVSAFGSGDEDNFCMVHNGYLRVALAKAGVKDKSFRVMTNRGLGLFSAMLTLDHGNALQVKSALNAASKPGSEAIIELERVVDKPAAQVEEPTTE